MVRIEIQIPNIYQTKEKYRKTRIDEITESNEELDKKKRKKSGEI